MTETTLPKAELDIVYGGAVVAPRTDTASVTSYALIPEGATGKPPMDLLGPAFMPIPEPSTLVLVAAGLVGLWWAGRK